MNRTISTTLAAVGLIVALLAGCNQRPGDAKLTPADTSAASPIFEQVESGIDIASEVLQCEIPLKVTEPADAAEINSKVVYVKGQTVPGAAVSANDALTTADPEGNFISPLNLETGPNAIDVIATDERGKQGEVLILVNVVS